MHRDFAYPFTFIEKPLNISNALIIALSAKRARYGDVQTVKKEVNKLHSLIEQAGWLAVSWVCE